MKQGIFINQSKYAKEIAKKFGLENTKPFSTLMSSNSKLDNDEKGMSVDQKLYRGMIRSLFYLTTSRPDIMFSVCLCVGYQSNPKESHLKAIKRIIRYKCNKIFNSIIKGIFIFLYIIMLSLYFIKYSLFIKSL